MRQSALIPADIAGWALRPGDNRYFALLERHGGKDMLGLYDVESFERVRVRLLHRLL